MVIVAKVDLRLVVDTDDQLAEELYRLIESPRAYVHGWVESRYTADEIPRSNINRQAIFRVKAKALNGDKESRGTNEPRIENAGAPEDDHG